MQGINLLDKGSWSCKYMYLIAKIDFKAWPIMLTNTNSKLAMLYLISSIIQANRQIFRLKSNQCIYLVSFNYNNNNKKTGC